MNVLLIGGAGYIGSRLSRALEARGHEIGIIDPGVLTGLGNPKEDVRSYAPASNFLGTFNVTIWLASIHDVGNDREADWAYVAEELMVWLPVEWALATHKAGGHFIYFSSTRAGTHTNRLYGRLKRHFEQNAVLWDRPPTIIRPGTVWGALSSEGGLPNRVHTVVNRMLVQPGWKPEPLEEPFFTCRYKTLEHVVCDLVEKPDHAWQGTIVPVTDTMTPLTGRRLRETAGRILDGFDAETAAAPFVPDLGEHPMEAYARYYGV